MKNTQCRRRTFSLQPFAPLPAALSSLKISGELLRSEEGLEVLWLVEGPVDEIVWSIGKGGRGRNLWQHSCFEVFVKVSGSSAYWEWNFTDRGEWDRFEFESYRKNTPWAAPTSGLTGSPLATRAAKNLELKVVIDAHFASFLSWAFMNALKIEVGIAAVIESKSAGLSYWALEHGDLKPDFHLASSFKITI